MASRLTDALSPYLRDHADNPVDWWEWSPQALAAARERDLPIFLSVGYAACHWCHVMAHESFEDDGVATVLNEHFVPIKVDREERPDIDAVYMEATQALTGHGGWPMTCLLTPDGRPFFAGTYLPRAQLLQLLDAAGTAWRGRREEIEHSAGRIADALNSLPTPDADGGPIDPATTDVAVEALAREFDHRHAGFGGAPKFPPSMVLEFLLRHAARTNSPAALEMAELTFEAMARGGIYDQLDGGFSRYSVDAAWVVPHFEKMLYDNAQLLRVALHLRRRTGSPLARRVADETADFLLTRLRTEQGAFASALDADTDGVEGATYVWTPEQLTEVLGADDGTWAAELLVVTDQGTFEDGASTLQLPHDPASPSAQQRWEGLRDRLRQARGARPQPRRDDKVVSGWNGMTIATLAEAGVLLDRPDLIEAATVCADHVSTLHHHDGAWRRVSLGDRVAEAPMFADDLGNLAEGLLILHQVTGAERHLVTALDLLQAAEAHRADDGGYHDTAGDGEVLLTRPRGSGDNAEPSGQSALGHALLAAWALTGRNELRERATAALAPGLAVAARDPRFAGWALAGAEAVLDGPRQVAVVGDPDAAQDRFADLMHAAWWADAPGLVRVSGSIGDQRPLLQGRGARGTALAHVCRGTVCDLPTEDPTRLRAQLATPTPQVG